MKKVSNRVIMLVIAMAMLFAMTTVAFAATYTGPFVVVWGSDKFNGKYTATLDVSATKTNAALTITGYSGIYAAETAAVLQGTVYTLTSTGEQVPITNLFASGGLSCSDERSYSGYTNVSAVCKYTFMGVELRDVTQ